MKKMISAIAITAISTSAFAFDYKINLEGRSDFIHTNTKQTAQSGTEASGQSNGFLSSLIRFNMSGTINENLLYRFRYRFNQEGSNTSRDASSNSLDYLYVDHKNAFFTTRFGKTMWAESYGRESFISSTDLFLASAAYNAYNTNIGNYRYGVSATYTFLDTNKLTLAVSNPNATTTDGGNVASTNAATATPAVGSSTVNADNKSLAYALHYSSVLFGKMFQPTLSYTMAKQDANSNAATPTVEADYRMMAAGFRTEAMEKLVVDADWKRFEKESSVSGGTEEKTSSIFANVAYNLGEVSPFVQYVNDKFKGANVDVYKQNSFAGGVMWKPFNDVNFRYHLLYTNIKRDYNDSAAVISKVTDNKVTFGIKADI